MFNKILLILLTINCSLLTAEAQWMQVSNGMGNQYVYSFAAIGNNLFAGGGIVYLTTNNGTYWTGLNQTATGNLIAANGNYVFAVLRDSPHNSSSIYRSSDNGTTWTLISLINKCVRSFATNGNVIFAGTKDCNQGNPSYYFFRSTDNGANWTLTSLNANIYSLATNGNNVFAGAYDAAGVFKSTDNGLTWIRTSLNNRKIYALAVNGNNIFAGTYNYPSGDGVYLSTNDGTSWAQTSLNNRTIQSLAVNGNNIFAGTDSSGVFVSNNNGTNWTQRNEGFPANVTVFALSMLNNYIFAGTNGNSVYRRPLSELTGIQPISEQVPAHYALEQNYPNPFNPTTRIRFDIPAVETHSNASLRIYDMLGREVTTLVNEELKPGTYEVGWDGSNYPSGVYYYKLVVSGANPLTTGDFAETKKMLLIK